MDLGSFKMLHDDFSALPEGSYDAVVEKIETRTSAAGDEYLALTLNVVQDGYDSRKIFDNFHLWHSNAKAVEISQKRISSLFKAAGYAAMGPTDDLLGKQISARLKVRKFVDKNGDEREANDVKGYFASSAPRMPSSTTNVSAANQQSDPWNRAA